MQTQISTKEKKMNQKAKSAIKAKTGTTSTERLQHFLADSFVLYMKTYAVHWNYQGPKFFAVHKLTEEQYTEMAKAIDELAERIRAKRDEAPFSLAKMLQTADLDELNHDGGRSDRSVRNLADSHQALSMEATKAIEELDDEDPYTVDMLTARVGAHDKAAWMLRSLLA
ncbi:MAG: DNA starvation/stationary phase protection protein [Bdellovibrionaceae bacterium]|nr:DNA starvation/stationary phase protection protein [Pseudobdellovibrionaceae bacterium]